MFKSIVNTILNLLVPFYGILKFVFTNFIWLALIIILWFTISWVDGIKVNELKTQNLLNQQNQIIATQIQAIKDLKTQQIAIAANQDRLNQISTAGQTIIQKQNDIKEIIHDTPIAQESCHPFSDNGLLSRFDIMRNYQQTNSNDFGSTEPSH